MALLLKLLTIFMLQVGVSLAGFDFKFDVHFKRVGEDILLNCPVDESSDQCSNTIWAYIRPSNDGEIKRMIFGGNVYNSSVRDSRLSLSSNCSLLITNITDEDAGLYICSHRMPMLLNTLSITSSPPDVNGQVDLTCSLKNYNQPGHCHPYPIWMDETGSQLSGKNPEFEVKKQTNCDSVLTVKHQSGNNKRFTCKFVEDEEVKIEADYVLTE
ncbi:uncharacterized protein LOC101158905 [Oryzias latipes]|uniref:uncharacterized protein LOC101158905 n=1 Tax=Oryzias latipes TaxID=8090 RepID=UPI0002A4982A|nr:uncharacterized protein LOC101158905 [Oryzias latipes]